ncbi:NB-ARC domain-containing protein [Micromonospora palomenae]|uniref:NB-ARC domain-containing protein n=1 Tax=Micromonospora palomenae TaxID=1461247 RepID=A0A561VHG2_9ACTN|nr:NB-ARC domain-containing protein [Micromonospora palomenae]TWG10994.1 NB-ARC domain-containing protein [Micromonospora palomenae]
MAAQRRALWLTLAVTGTTFGVVGLAALAVFLYRQRLDDADQYSSVVGAAAAALTLAGTVIVWLFRRIPVKHVAEPVSNSSESTSAEPVLCGTELPPTHFVGRQHELDQLEGWFAEGDAAPPLLVLGEAGVGKSGLLAYWSDRLHRGLAVNVLGFNLGGFGQPGSRKNVSDAFGEWLAYLRPGKPIPQDPTARRVSLMNMLRDRRCLLIFDNVNDYTELRAVLPAIPKTCSVVISSRRELRGLRAVEGARTLHVGRLGEDATRLLDAVMGGRLAGNPEIAQKLSAYCAGLPLALRVVAETARDRRLDEVLAELTNKAGALTAMSRLGDELSDIRVVLSWSYEALPSDAARQAFRLLGVFPAKGSTASLHAMAALLGLDVASTRDVLDVVRSYHLLEWAYDPSVERHLVAGVRDKVDQTSALALRIGRHDLLHSFAAELAAGSMFAEEIRDALTRVSELYHNEVNEVFDWQNRDNLMVDLDMRDAWRTADPIGVQVTRSTAGPFQWFERERTNFVALVIQAAALTPPLPITTRLACSAFYFLEAARSFDEWDRVEMAASPHAQARDGDRLDLARWLRNRGRRHLVTLLEHSERLQPSDGGRTMPTEAAAKARRYLEHSLRLYRQESTSAVQPDRQRRAVAGVATTMRELADLRRLEAEFGTDPKGPAEAVAAYKAARAAFGDYTVNISTESQENWIASFELAFGVAYLLLGADEPAALADAGRLIDRSIAYAETLEDGRSRSSRLKAFGWRRHGDLQQAQGNHEDAAGSYATSATAFEEEVSDPLGCARSLAYQGRALGLLPGHEDAAARVFARAIRLFQDNGAGDEAAIAADWARTVHPPH